MKAKKGKGRKSEDHTPEEYRKAGAVAYLTPSKIAANAIHTLTQNISVNGPDVTGLDFNTLEKQLQAHNQALFDGDLRRVEAMLLDQAHVLQAIFTMFTQKMGTAQYIEQLDAYSRISLKAQNQCRQTLATLGELKNPKRATFVKQQNNAINQQINQNGELAAENRKNSGNSANELLEEIPSERLDIGTQETTGRADQAMEAVGKVHGAENCGREGKE